jgi:hypothetical protein
LSSAYYAARPKIILADLILKLLKQAKDKGFDKILING